MTCSANGVDRTEPKRAEQTLRESEAKSQAEDELRAIIDNAPVFLWSDLPDGYCDFLNQPWLTYFNLSLQEAQGTGWMTLLHPDDAAHHLESWQKSVATGIPFETEARFRRPDGEYRWFLTRANPLRDNTGRIVKWYGTNIDIENLKQTEGRLRQSEANLAEAQRLSHTGSWALSPTTTNILYWSAECYRIWGFDPVQGLPNRETVWRRIHPDDRGRMLDEVQQALRQKKDYTIEFRIVLPDGTVKYLEAIGHHLFSEHGELVQIVGTNVDLTERKRAEEALRRSEAYLAESQKMSHTCSAAFNEAGMLYFSEEASRMFGFNPLQGIPSREAVWQRIHPDDLDRLNESIECAVREKRSRANEFRIVLPDGTVKHVESTCLPAFSASGELVEIIGTGVDVTERKRAEEALREREAKIRRLVDANIIGIFMWDFDGRILEANEAFLRIVGYEREDLVAGRIRWTDLTPPEWHDRDARLIQEHKVAGILQPFEKEYFRKDRSRVPVLIGVATFEEGGNQGVAFVLDLTERKRAEGRLRVQHTVAQILAEAATIEEATPRILLAMGECLGWDVGALWRVDREAEVLRCVELWHNASIEVPEFERASRGVTFRPGLGLPGRVWSSRNPEYIPNIVFDENFRRAPIAEREGLRAAFGFPILLGGEALGAIEFFSREIRQPDQALLNVLATIGSQIGQFIERKRAEAELRESEQNYRTLFESIDEGFCTIEVLFDQNEKPVDYRFLQVSPSFERQTGIKNAAGRRMREIAPRHEEHWFETYGRIALTGEPIRFENEAKQLGRWYDVYAFRVEDPNRRRVGILFNDITERKRAEEALRESEGKLRQLIESVPCHFWSANPDGQPTYVNQRLRDYFGIRPSQDLKPDIAGTVHPDDVPETERALNHAFQTGETFQRVHRLRRADGEYRWHRVCAEPLRNKKGDIIQWYGFSVDIDEGKKAEDQLRRSEAWLAHAQKLTRTGNWVLDVPAKRFLYWSDECYRIWGFDPLQGLPSRESMWERIHPDDRDRVWEEVQEAEREKRSFFAEFRILLPDGTVKYLEANTHHEFALLGEVVEAVSTQVDVTENKRSEQALRESEARFRDYAETASDWFWEIGPDYKFTLLTENAFGSHAADRMGTACWDHALDLETEPEKWRLVRATLDARRPFRDFVYRTLGGDGSPMYVRASGKPMFGANGEFHGYRGTGADVTAIMRAQEALRESEQKLRSAIDGVAGLVAIMAPNGELETVNRQIIEYFGRSPEELANWGTSDAVHPEDLPRIIKLFKRSIAAGIPFHFELRLRRFDGQYRWFENRGAPIRDESGRIVRWYVLLVDIEDRTRALARLQQMESDFAHMNRVSMMGELAASLSHEITQPIAAARNYARAALNFLDQQPPNLGEVKQQLDRVVSAADRSGEIIDRIREHIKKAPPRKGPFDLNEAIDEVLSLTRNAITENEVSLRTRFTEGLPAAFGDRVQVQQVVLNLVLNAVDAMASVEARTRLLLISTELNRADEVLVAFRDSGPGIEPDHLERVFEAFYTTKSHGVGMGLSICRSIISAQGGRIWADTKKPRGAIFLFTLPAEKEITDSRSAPLQTRERSGDSTSEDFDQLA